MRNIHQIMRMVSVLCLLALPLQAQEEGMTLEDFLKAAENDDNLQEQIAESAELFDVNDDNKISLNEVIQATKGLTSVPDNIYTETEKKEMETYFLQAFYESDLNNDNELTDAEGTAFAKVWQQYALKKQFHKMDRNGDGIINENDMPTLEESTQKIEESMKRLDEVQKKLEETKPEEMADNWIKSMQTAIADEDYYQMDKNHDNCVTQAEYLAYSAANQDDEETSDELILRVRKMKAVREYLDIKKETPDCLTMEEYITNENLPIEEILKENIPDKETETMYASILYEAMDSDNNNELTTEEYVAYENAEYKDICTNCIETTDIYTNLFNNATSTGKMNKEEFIVFYLKESDKDEVGEVDKDWFAKADINQDNCISMEEYVRSAADEDTNKIDELMTKRIYIEIKKQQPDCLLKEEANAVINQTMEEVLAKYKTFNAEVEALYAAEVFAVADSNADGHLTTDEYVAFEFAEYKHYTKDIETTPEDDAERQDIDRKSFLSRAPQGFMEKEEFVRDYVENARQAHAMRAQKH